MSKQLDLFFSIHLNPFAMDNHCLTYDPGHICSIKLYFQRFLLEEASDNEKQSLLFQILYINCFSDLTHKIESRP